MTVLVFDIETVPDVESARRLHGLEGLNDSDTAEALFALRRAKTGNDFLPHYLQKIVAISLVLATGKQLKVWSLGDINADEKDLISRFYSGIDRYTPTLVSWNGAGFDLPVLHYRALLNGVAAPTYWEAGDNVSGFRYNNYLNRYHYRHLDLMDVLSAYQTRASAPLDDIATMLGFPGKMGMSGSKVWEHYQAGNLEGIRNYCETDVLNTYGVYLRFEQMRGVLSTEEYTRATEQLRECLTAEASNRPHLGEFLQHWVCYQ